MSKSVFPFIDTTQTNPTRLTLSNIECGKCFHIHYGDNIVIESVGAKARCVYEYISHAPISDNDNRL